MLNASHTLKKTDNNQSDLLDSSPSSSWKKIKFKINFKKQRAMYKKNRVWKIKKIIFLYANESVFASPLVMKPGRGVTIAAYN